MKRSQEIVMSRRKINELKATATEEALIVFTACIMDEYGLEEEDIIEVWKRMERYASAIQDHTITIERVRAIIKEETGLSIVY